MKRPRMEVDCQKQIFEPVDALVNAWCDRRCLNALRNILQGWPLSSPLTDGWNDLLVALKDTRAFAGGELTESELNALDKVVAAVEVMLSHRG